MKHFINHFRKDSKHLDHQKSKTTKAHQQVEVAKELINSYRTQYANVDLDVLRNLIELKEITSEPKQDNPDNSYKEIKKRLGPKESIETLSQERWHNKIACPACGSKKIEQVNSEFKYHCVNCNNSFNDDTGTPIEAGSPPLSTWMFCWYLLGCTDSLQYIASKLGLDLPMVELMVRHMRQLFKSNQPLKHFMSFDEWSLKHGKSYKHAIQKELAHKKELLGHDSGESPKDTAEYRRQKQRAQDPHKHTPKTTNRPRNRGA